MREAEVQQPNTAATLSLISSFLDFSAKVGQSLAPSSWMILILRPRMPPVALIWSMASRSAWIDPVSLMAIVPVALCSWPTVTSVSVTARPVLLTCAVAIVSAWAGDAAASNSPVTNATPVIVVGFVLRIMNMRNLPCRTKHLYVDSGFAGMKRE